MKYFRIHLYLNIKNFLKSVFLTIYKKKHSTTIKSILIKNSKKKYVELTSQCRIAFLIILQYFKKNISKKNEIIFLAYNLPEMINVAKNLNFKIILCDLDYKTGFYDLKKLRRKINNKTVAVVLTNMFNSYEQGLKLKKICSLKKIFLIEDNAIYFDNYKTAQNTKKYSGLLGDFTIYSFNIMKNISGLYGGAVTSNNKNFNSFSKEKILEFRTFPKIILYKQIIMFFVLKTLSINMLYKYLFFGIIKYVYINKIDFLLKQFYPSLKFKIKKFPTHYFTNISELSKKIIFYQLTDVKKRNQNHKSRKYNNIYYYNKFNKIRLKQVKLIKIYDFNYQNFIDFPILAKNRIALNKFY